MNYFDTLVILRESFEPLSVKTIVHELKTVLEPYSECFIPDGATDCCGCITLSAEKVSLEKIDQLVDDFLGNLLEELDLAEEWKLFKKGEKNYRSTIYTLEKIESIINTISSERTRFMADSARKYFPLQTPDPECPWCKGKGTVRAMINPNKKFDTWSLNNYRLRALETVYENDEEGVFTEETAHRWLKRQLAKTDDLSGDMRYGAILSPDGIWHGKYSPEENRHYVESADKIIKNFPGHYVITCQMSY